MIHANSPSNQQPDQSPFGRDNPPPDPQAAPEASWQSEAKESMGERVRRGARSFGHQAREGLSHFGQSLREQSGSAAQAHKHKAAEQIDHYCQAINSAAQSLRERDDEAAARVLDQFASYIRSTHDYLTNRELTDMIDDARQFVRRRPAVFFGVMFLGGLALGRFLKAAQTTSTEHDEPRGYGEPSQPLAPPSPPMSPA